MEYTKPKTTKLEEILLYFICRAGVYPFDKMGVAPYVAFLRKVREVNIEGVSIPEDEEEILELVDNLITSLVDKCLVVVGDGEYLIPFRDCDAVKISFKDMQKIALITNCLTNSDWAYYSAMTWEMK